MIESVRVLTLALDNVLDSTIEVAEDGLYLLVRLVDCIRLIVCLEALMLGSRCSYIHASRHLDIRRLTYSPTMPAATAW